MKEHRWARKTDEQGYKEHLSAIAVFLKRAGHFFCLLTSKYLGQVFYMFSLGVAILACPTQAHCSPNPPTTVG